MVRLSCLWVVLRLLAREECCGKAAGGWLEGYAPAPPTAVGGVVPQPAPTPPPPPPRRVDPPARPHVGVATKEWRNAWFVEMRSARSRGKRASCW